VIFGFNPGNPEILSHPLSDMQQVVLQARGISKSYDGVHALRGVSFELRVGEVHALIGENGAGKSTLIKIITGAITADSGQLELDGAIVANQTPAFAKALGIAAIYQQPALFPELSVAENIALGLEEGSSWRLINWKERRQRAAALLERIGARIDPEAEAGQLTMPEQQLVEIARALGAKARVLIMDEPTASLSEEETQNLYRVIDGLRSEGVGIIYISHRLEELEVMADRVTVLRDGAFVGTEEMASVTRSDLIRMMVGRELSAIFPKREVEQREVVLELRNLSCRANGTSNVDLSVRGGEIVGLAGLVGGGRTELARTIFGLEPADSGEILINGQSHTITEPARAIALGIAYLPEDRRRHGVVLDMAIDANVTLASLDKLSTNFSYDVGKERSIAATYVRRFSIKTPALFSAVTTLSGGNQQKVALSRWLETQPRVLILDEPTQGIDVGAKAEIHNLMVELAAQGAAILMISSELPEILGMSDRVVVMREGTVAGILSRAEATQDLIMSLALSDLPQRR
jgi:rhamnose transport system ATP-binding protein